jgi:hypothetical protein
MKFRTLAYGEDVQGTIDNSKGCDSTIYGADDAPINGKLLFLNMTRLGKQH